MTKVATLLSLVVLVFAGAAFAAVAVPVGSCYHCILVDADHYDCRGGFDAGGVSCTASGTSCTVNGICPKAVDPVEEAFSLTLPADLVRDIAQVNPRLAATLLRLSKAGKLQSQTLVYWIDRDMNASHVERMIKGERVDLRGGTGQEVVYKATILRGAGGTGELVIAPLAGANVEPTLVVDLAAAKSSFAAKDWFMY
jgi:hypothetical protein